MPPDGLNVQRHRVIARTVRGVDDTALGQRVQGGMGIADRTPYHTGRIRRQCAGRAHRTPIAPRSVGRSGRIEGVSDIAAADERAILDQLRQLQDAHHRGDTGTANALLSDLFTRYGEEAVKAVRRRQDGDRLAADLNLFGMFGTAGLIGDD